MAQTQMVRGVATTVSTSLTHISVTYHSTEVARVNRIAPRLATVELNTGGYFTNTTKLRMNQFAAQYCNHQFGVYQKKGEWFVSINGVVNPVKFVGDKVMFPINGDKVNFPKEEE